MACSDLSYPRELLNLAFDSTVKRLAAALLLEGLLPDGTTIQCHGDGAVLSGHAEIHSHKEGGASSARTTTCATIDEVLDAVRPSLLSVEGATAENFEELRWELRNSWENEVDAVGAAAQWRRSLARQAAKVGASSLVDLWRPDRLRSAGEAMPLWERFASLAGHPRHPCARIRVCPALGPVAGVDGAPGSAVQPRKVLSCAEVRAVAPEFGPDVGLIVGALRRRVAAMVRIVGDHDTYEAILRRALSFKLWDLWRRELEAQREDPDDFVPLPVHPCSVQRIRRLFARQLATGDVVVLESVRLPSWPTTSLRTMILQHGGVAPAVRYPPHLKLPVPIQTTSIMRYLSPAEVQCSPLCTAVLDRIRERHRSIADTLVVLREAYGVTLNYKEAGASYEDARYLSCLIRQDPTAALRDGEFCAPVCALLDVDPIDDHGRTVIGTIALAWVSRAARAGKSTMHFFSDLARVVLQGVLGVWVRYGVALEAHGQNTLVVFSRDHSPRCVQYRDIAGGIFIHRETLRNNAAFSGALSDEAMHERQDMLATHSKALACVMHAAFSSTLIPLADALKPMGSDLNTSAFYGELAALTQECIARQAADHEATGGIAKRQAFREHCEVTLQALLGTNESTEWHVKALLTMRLRQSKHEAYVAVPNPLARSSTSKL